MSYDVVDPMDVYMAMAASLMEKQPVPFNPIYAIRNAPPKKQLRIGGRPPPEVFYKDTLTYMTKLPPPVKNKMCSCKFLCTGAQATKICHSCSIYDPTRSAYYCAKCFTARHPWFRASHVATDIENDESIDHTMKVAHRLAEAKRYEMEGTHILKNLQAEKPKLAFVADDEKVDNKLRAYGRRMVALEDHLQQLRQQLREDIMFGDEKRRRSLYSRERTDEAQEDVSIANMTELFAGPETVEQISTVGLLENHPHEPPVATPLELPGTKVRMLRDMTATSSFFESGPVFGHLREESAALFNISGDNLPISNLTEKDRQRQFQLLRAGTAESLDSMTLSPMDERRDAFPFPELTMPVVNSSAVHEVDRHDTESVVSDITTSHYDNHGNSMYSLQTVQDLSSTKEPLSTGISTASAVSAPQPFSAVPVRPSDPTPGDASITSLSISSAGSVVTAKTTASSVAIQRVFKGHLARRVVSKLLTVRIMRVFSEEAGRDYYYDTVTGASNWLPSKLLRAEHYDELQYVSDKGIATAHPAKWCCKLYCPRRYQNPVIDARDAAVVLQSFARCILARRRIVAKADETFRRVFDEETNSYYYANVILGTTSWHKSTVYLRRGEREPSIYRDVTGSTKESQKVQNGSVKNHRSPRRNRV